MKNVSSPKLYIGCSSLRPTTTLDMKNIFLETASDKIIKVLPKFNRTNRLKIVLRPFDIFSKKFEERYFVLRNTPAGELPTREDSVKVIEIYE